MSQVPEQFYDVLRSDRTCPPARSGHPVRLMAPRPVPCTDRGYQTQTCPGSLGILDLGALAVVCVWDPPCCRIFPRPNLWFGLHKNSYTATGHTRHVT